VEADSGGYTDQGVALALVPAMIRLRDELTNQYQYGAPIAIVLYSSGSTGVPKAVARSYRVMELYVTLSIDLISEERLKRIRAFLKLFRCQRLTWAVWGFV
jgi:trans-AT polyketide synthase, acyltransferase and oxidoreductase domains